MTLEEKQPLFAQLVADLILHAHAEGYRVTFGEAWRSPQEAKRNAAAGTGIVNSLHCERLAIDLNLFQNGVYLTTTEAYEPLGAYWESLSGDDYQCCWGGRFTDAQGRPKPDADHFSIAHGGRK